MVDWDPAQRLPVQVGDAFACLYDWLENHHKQLVENEEWFRRFGDEEVILPLIADVTATELATPDSLQRRVPPAARGTERELAYACYECLHAIDQGLARFDPIRGKAFGSSRTGAGATLLTHYRQHGRINTHATNGYVLPKRTGPRFGGTAFAEHFSHLIRALPNSGFLQIRPGRGTHFTALPSSPTVAIVPFLYALDDVSFKADPKRKRSHFVMSYTDLRDRVVAAVDAIRRKQCNIVIFPELALDETLLATLREQMHATDDESAALVWVIAGAARPPEAGAAYGMVNEAVVLDSAGNIVRGLTPEHRQERWIQRKRHRYTMSIAEQKRYGLTECFGSRAVVPRTEAIAVGVQQVVFEDLRARRFAVLICEDLAQEEGTTSIVRQVLCNVVFTIVLDGPTTTERWAAKRTESLRTQTGATTLLANSLLLTNRPKCLKWLADKDIDLTEPVSVGLLYSTGEVGADPPAPSVLKAALEPDARDSAALLSDAVALPLVLTEREWRIS